MITWILALSIAYLLGSIPFGYVLVRTVKHEDVRATGSGNIGATNVARSGGKTLGILTLVLDALKGFLAVVIAQKIALMHTYPDAYRVAAAAALMAVIGHIFTVWLGFKGGKGVATALGVFLALSPLAALIALLVFLAIVFITKYVSLGSVVGAVVLAAGAIWGDEKHVLFVDLCYIAIALLVIVKHSANIQRLMSGTENKFGAKKTA